MKIPLIDIPCDARGIFRKRPNRFLGIVDVVEPKEYTGIHIHVHDPGRLPDILYAGNEVLLRRAEGKKRKTNWDLLAGKCNGNWVLVHSGYHRRIVEEILNSKDMSPFSGIRHVYPERKSGKSRLDFLIEHECGKQTWVEVKGCTLALGDVASFPDAPTERGRRHVQELMNLLEDGSGSAILFLVFRPEARCFLPNEVIDPAFDHIFWEASQKGVRVYPIVLQYQDETIYYKGPIPVCRRLE